MVFKSSKQTTKVSDGPDKLFLDLPRRKYTGLLDHQGQMLRAYTKTGIAATDVALQLPTGSGKTLVGLLIAEWRRRSFDERALYLCPTNQLVNQVAEEARSKYGLEVDAFTGSAREYDSAARTRYLNADRVAITNYSSVFNTRPTFKEPQIVILDDAHASENYIAKLWSFRVDSFTPEHQVLFSAIANVLTTILEPHLIARLTGNWESLTDKLWVDKIPTPDFVRISSDLREVIDLNIGDLDLKYPWKMISDHLEACQMYVGSSEFLIRPLIPPTWDHRLFNDAKQRIFMSATLGAGGDLERLTGRKIISRLAIPDGWDKQGIGRRFFVFPGMSLNEEDSASVRLDLMRTVPRSVVLVPSDSEREAIYKTVSEEGFSTYSATDIENTKASFVSADNAVAIIANRYDGIDFPGDDCRLLFIEGLPKATNLQERFLMARMGANLLLNERVQTRVLQAAGRCTRGLNDYSTVVVSGAELTDYLTDKNRRKFLHPELQAEIEFGVYQSQDVDTKSLVENIEIFLEHGKDWEEVNKDILSSRDSAKQLQFPAMDELSDAVKNEINYQTRMWQGDYETAYEEACEVLGKIVHPELRGYRALWHYLAGSAAELAASKNVTGMSANARTQFRAAKEAARGIPWLVSLSRFDPTTTRDASAADMQTMKQVERIEAVLTKLGKTHNRAYSKLEAEILQGLAGEEHFEAAQTKLGELLGYSVGKIEEDASPDPWWLSEKHCFVFEDHAGAKGQDAAISATKARQAASHVQWIKTNLKVADEVAIRSILVTPATAAKKGAEPSLKSVSLWSLEEFRQWAKNALAVIRAIRTSFTEIGDLDWRIKAAEALEEAGLNAISIDARLAKSIAADKLTIEK